MEITDVRVFPVDDEKLKAYVSVVLDGCFMVNDIKVVSGRDGLFISMPSRKRKNGDYKDVAHPLNQETRRRFEEQILGEYRIALGIASGADRSVAVSGSGDLRDVPAEIVVDAAPLPAPAVVAGRLATAAAVVLLALPAEPPSNSLEELERKHSADQFWGVD